MQSGARNKKTNFCITIFGRKIFKRKLNLKLSIINLFRKNDSDGKKFGKIQNDQKSPFEISFSNENGENSEESWKKATQPILSSKDLYGLIF